MDPDDLARRAATALEPLAVVRVAWLFGSQVTGRAGPRSDLDIAVVHPRELDDAGREQARRRIVAALTDALGRIGERSDVVDVDRTGSAVAFNALRDGRRLVSRSEAERIAAEVRIMRRYDDEAPRRALFRRAARNLASGPDPKATG